ncbi:MAG: hypothetical protein S4CHLAM20_05950 [Chlamydiia bacterium]|nr:hypothetical protein [Chlamydiia bacterium]
MKQKLHRRLSFTLIEICICLSILIMLTSTFAFIGYDAIKEFRKRNAITAFHDYLYTLRNLNASAERNIMLIIDQEGDFVKTKLDGNTAPLKLKSRTKTFYMPHFLENNKTYTISISAYSLPTSQKNIPTWIEKHDCSGTFFE